MGDEPGVQTGDAGPTATFRTEAGDEVVVHVAGELDAASSVQLRTILSEAFAASPSRVAVDFTELVFIDSVGLSLLVSAHQRGNAEAVPFEVRSVPPSCRRVFEITKLDDLFDLT